MTRQDKITAATPLGGTASAPVPAFNGAEATLINEASARNDGWGSQPICPNCNRGARYGCICDPFYADDDQTPAEDCTRIMESIKRINWLALGLDKPEGFERVEA